MNCNLQPSEQEEIVFFKGEPKSLKGSFLNLSGFHSATSNRALLKFSDWLSCRSVCWPRSSLSKQVFRKGSPMSWMKASNLCTAMHVLQKHLSLSLVWFRQSFSLSLDSPSEMSVWVVGTSRGAIEAYFVCQWVYFRLISVYACVSRDWLVCSYADIIQRGPVILRHASHTHTFEDHHASSPRLFTSFFIRAKLVIYDLQA